MRPLLPARVRRFVSVITAFTLVATTALSTVPVAYAAGTVSSPPPVAAPPIAAKPSEPASATVVRELVDKRTSSSTSYLLSDGSIRAEIQQAPVRFKDKAGAWKPIDTALVPADLTGRVRSASTPVAATFGAQGPAAAPVTLAGDGYSVGIDYLGAVETSKLTLGNRVVYRNVGAGADLVYEAKDDGIKETIVLASASSPSTFRFALSLDGLSMRRDFTGGWGLFCSGEDTATLSLAPLVVFDSSVSGAGDPAYCAGATMTVTPAGDVAYVTYEVPRDWLEDPARVFPVMVDPTLTLTNAGATYGDTYISSEFPTTKYWTSAELRCGYYDSTTGHNRTHVRFDLSSVPASAYVNDTIYKIHQFHQYYVTTPSTTTYLGSLIQSFSSGTTWNTQGAIAGHPEYKRDYIGSKSVSSRDVDLEWSVDDTVQHWLDGTKTNFGFLHYQSETSAQNTTHWRKFRSEEYSVAADRPTLWIQYSTPNTHNSSMDKTAYLPGEVAVATARFNSGFADDINAIKMSVRGMDGATPVTRGAFLWSQTAPTGNWISHPCAGTAGGFVSYDPTAPGAGMVELLPDQSSAVYDGPGNFVDANFAFRISPLWGDVQSNDLLVTGWMGATDGNDTTSNYCSGERTNGISFGILPTAPASVIASTTATEEWFTETDPDGDGVSLDRNDANTSGRGTASLTWDGVAGASAYRVYLFDGNAYQAVATTTAEAWSSAGAALFPTDSQIAALATGTADNPYLSGTGLDLRDDPTPLYAKTAGASVDGIPAYFFKVTGVNSVGETALSEAPTITAQLDKRTLGANDDVRHATFDVGSWAEHGVVCMLDTGSVRMSVTDLAIASWGPLAHVSRVYDSIETTSGLFGPGWRFNFEQRIEISGSSRTFVDDRGDRHRFLWSSGAWRAPVGFDAQLATETVGAGTGHRLGFRGGSSMLFDSAGSLVEEADNNGNTVDYDRSVADQLTITAANGQSLVVSLSQGKATGARLATGDGTREVAYSGLSYGPGQWTALNTCTYYPGTSDQRTIDYDYSITNTPGKFYLTDLSVREVENADWSLVAIPDLSEWSDSGRGDGLLTSSGRTATLQHSAEVVPEHYHGWTHPSYFREFEWNPSGTMARESNPYAFDDAVRWNVSTYGPANRLSTQADPLGDMKQWVYDDRGNLVASIDQEQHATSYVYGTSGGEKDRVVSETDPIGATTTRSYDASGNATTETRGLSDTDFARTAWTYDGAGRVISEQRRISDDSSATTTYGDFAPSGEPQATSNLAVKLGTGQSPITVTEHITYDDFGDVVRRTDALGSVVESNTHSPGGYLTDSQDASGTIKHTDFDALGRTTSTRRNSGVTTVERVDYALDSQGSVTREDHFDGSQISYSVEYHVDALGRTLSATDSIKGDTAQWFDAQGNVAVSWGPEASAADSHYPYNLTAATRSKYDAANRLVASIAPGNDDSQATTSTHSPAGNVVREDFPDGSWVEYAYDAAGNKTGETHPTEGGGTVTDTSVYDLGGRLVSVTKAAGTPEEATTAYEYDALDRQTSAQLREPSGTVYNTLGWVLESTDFDGIVTSSIFDAAGRLVSETIGGKTSTSVYDGMGRVTQRTDPAGVVVSSVFDALGRATQETHAKAGISIKSVVTSYDALSRAVTATETASGGGTIASRFAYAAGETKVSTATVSCTGVTSTVTYDRLSRESSRTVVSGSLALARWVTARDPEGRPLSWTTGAASSAAAYTPQGQVEAFSGPGVAGTATVQYDDETARETTESLPLSWSVGAYVASYSYTDAGRLSRVASGTTTWDYAFDDRGNLVGAKSGSDTTVTLAYDQVTSRLLHTAIGASVQTTFTYDTLGRRIAQGPPATPSQTALTFDDASLLTRWARPSASTTGTYTYDGAGQRVHSSVSVGSASTETTYTYQGLTLLALAARQSDGTTYALTYLNDEAGRPYAAVYAASDTTVPLMIQLVTSVRGDVVELTDSGGSAFAVYRYDAWGNPIASATATRAAGTIDAVTAGRIASRQPLRYAGYAWDAHSGLYYCSQRYYDPATFQFISKDAARADGEESAYQYCGGDPVGSTDPSGMYELASLTFCERNLYANHWLLALRVNVAKEKAEAQVDRYYSRGFADNNADAFRYAFWNALMCMSVGPDWAKEAATAHEIGARQTLESGAMDLANNAIGRGAWRSHRNSTESGLASVLRTWARHGALRRIVDDRGVHHGSLIRSSGWGER